MSSRDNNNSKRLLNYLLLTNPKHRPKIIRNRTSPSSPSKLQKRAFSKTKQRILLNFKQKYITPRKIIANNLKKYNSTPKLFYSNLITTLIYDENTHFVSLFKEYLYWDDEGEFLKRFYRKKELRNKFKGIFYFYFKEYKCNGLFPIFFRIGDCSKMMNEYYIIKRAILMKSPPKRPRPPENNEEEKIFKTHLRLVSTSMTLSKVNGNEFNLEEVDYEKVCVTTRNKNGHKTVKNSIDEDETTIQSLLNCLDKKGVICQTQRSLPKSKNKNCSVGVKDVRPLRTQSQPKTKQKIKHSVEEKAPGPSKSTKGNRVKKNLPSVKPQKIEKFYRIKIDKGNLQIKNLMKIKPTKPKVLYNSSSQSKSIQKKSSSQSKNSSNNLTERGRGTISKIKIENILIKNMIFHTSIHSKKSKGVINIPTSRTQCNSIEKKIINKNKNIRNIKLKKNIKLNLSKK